MKTDARANPVSCDDGKAIELCETALLQFQSYIGDAIATLDQALTERPDFVLAHAVRAGILMTFGEARFAAMAKENVAEAQKLVHRANDREKGLIAAAQHLVNGAWDKGCAAYDRVLADYPRDIFAAQTAHLMDFFRGDALNLRNRIARVLPYWSPRVPGYPYLLGMYAFGLEECQQYAEAETTALRALDLEPKDGWSVHAAVHVYEMNGRVEEGIHFLESRESDWAPNNAFAFHNWWHLALFHFDRGQYGRVLDLYDRVVYPSPPMDLSLTMVDATTLLWRLHLTGVDVGSRFGTIADQWERKLGGERGFYAFNDLHAMIAFVATEREASINQLLEDIDHAAGAITLNGMMSREVSKPLARAFVDFGRGRYEEAVETLISARDGAWRFGGSHAQRDVISLTLIEGALRSKQNNLARHYIAERTVAKPMSALGWRLQSRAHELTPK